MKGRDIGEEILVKQGLLITAVTAAGTGDNTEIDGTTIDRQALGSLYESGKLIVVGNGTVADGETLSIAANFQDSADGSSWADFGTALAAANVLAPDGESFTAEAFQTELDVDIRGARRHIRCQVLPDMSASGTDTSVVGGVIVLGGASEYPAA